MRKDALRSCFRSPAMLGFAALLLGSIFNVESAAANGKESPANATGLQLPRFVSLKSDRVNLREGPSTDHRTAWIFQRAGLPVEITAEFDSWRRIRDSDGSEGWVQKSLLSGRRTALIQPWKKGDLSPLRLRPDTTSALTAEVQSGVLATVRGCENSWCRVTGDGFDGFIEQNKLWGVYPDEKL